MGCVVVAVRTIGDEAQAVVWELAKPDRPVVAARWPIRQEDDPEDQFFARFSPDGKQLAVAAADFKAVRVIDSNDRPARRTCRAPSPAACARSPGTPTDRSSPSLLAPSRGASPRVVLWDLNGNAELARVARV